MRGDRAIGSRDRIAWAEFTGVVNSNRSSRWSATAFQWSISGSKDSPSTSVPSSDVTIGEGEADGIYTIDISDKNFRGRRLVARRRYPIEEQQEIQLPSIPGATSQSSEVLIGPGLTGEKQVARGADDSLESPRPN